MTFVFTDIEGSTKLLHELGPDGYASALAEHRRVVRGAFGNGFEVDTQGDAFFFAFARASDAIAACEAAVAGLVGGPIRIRVGVHTGEPMLTEDGYVGVDVHRAARIAGVGHGGQICVSQTTRDLVPDADLLDLGLHRLKDLTSPERIFQLGAGDFPALKSLNRTNLPVAAGPLIGRERELAEIAHLLRDSSRIVTLTGPGGSGKTRLALQVAADLLEEHPDGVFFVGLAALSEPSVVPSALAAALGLGTDTDVLAQIAAKHALIVLDNAEHLELSPFVAELVATCPDVRLVVTSRSPLHLSTEQEYVVEPLATAPAVELFVARAAAVGERTPPGGAVAEICRRLDCLPLAVELAAARMKLLSPDALLRRLEHVLPMLTGGPRDAPERQRTLRATIAWSYDLLGADAQALFRRLSAFRGTFSADAAAAVAGAELDDLATLVDQSLLKHVGDDRFLLLETLREFGVERSSDDEIARTLDAHTAYYLSVIEEAAPWLEGPELPAARARLLDEVPNLREMLDRLADNRDAERLAAVVNGLWRFWPSAGMLRDNERYATLALEVCTALPDDVQILLLRNAVWAHAMLGHWEAARTIGDERLRLARALGDQGELVGALMSSAVASQSVEDFETARALGIEAVAIARETGDPLRICTALGNLAVTEQQRGDVAACERLTSEEVEIRRTLGNPNWTAHALSNLGMARAYGGDPEAALPCFQEALPTLIESNLTAFGWGLAGVALVAWTRGDMLPAARLLARGEALHREMGYTHTDTSMAAHYEKTRPLRDARADPAIDAAWRDGEAMTLEEALAEALAQ